MKNQKKKIKPSIFFLALALALLPLISAVTIENGTIINTTVSNSSMTFTSSVDVDLLVVDSENITLTNITCTDGGFSPISNLFWNDTNSNLDSVFYCGANVFLKLNENSGATAFDVSAEGNDGVISGATYDNDGINLTLIAGRDYTLLEAEINITNQSFDATEINLNWVYLSRSRGEDASDNIIDAFLTYPVLIGLVGTVIFLGLIIVILFVAFGPKPKV